MFLGKKALSLKTLKTLPLAIVAVAAGILGLVWLGADDAEAKGRSIPLTRNELTVPASGGGNAPCLQSLVEWEPLGSKVEVEFYLQSRNVGNGTWKRIATDVQPLPGKATGASVDWGIGAPGLEYRHWFQLYSVKGKDGASRNHQLTSELSSATPVFGSCG